MNYFTRKEQIILSAIDIIDKLGIDGLSVRELAKKENITEGALYRHFKSKNQIIIEALRYYARFDTNIINTIEQNNFDSKSAIIFLMKAVSEYYENYPEITAVACSFESFIYEPEIENEFNKINSGRSEFIKSIIENGKKSGQFSLKVDSDDLTDIIIGSFRYIVFRWRYEKYKFSLKKKTLSMITMILDSISD